MKKKLFLLIPLLIISSLAFAREEKDRKFFGFQFALGADIPFYGDSVQWNNHERMSNDKYGRVILGGDVGFTLKFAEPLFMVFDFETCSDFAFNKDYNCNCIDYAFCLGFQFYPGWGNLSFTLAYALGYRADFIKLSDEYAEARKTKWGNGFKFAMEYDFFKGGGTIPAAGISYRFMPRGYDEYDNILSIYFRLAFR
ncbi:MAG: hypothetical protein KBS84_01830 [Treponema sp.]|nr:hypothetical protein [Candidatus Treponema scatequi]